MNSASISTSGQPAGGGLHLPKWLHLSSKKGDLPEPNGGTQQTACVVGDIDRDGAADIVVAERTQAPALIWLRRRAAGGWEKYVIDSSAQRPEAGGLLYDVDGDGYPDLIIGGDYRSDELWWYENPGPDFRPEVPWKRHLIKQGGGKAHHDQAVADFKGVGRPQLAFWNQGAKKLFLADLPTDPCREEPWPCVEIFDCSHLAGLKQEGMFACDIDGDGKSDLLAGQFWFKHLGGNEFRPIQICDSPGRVVAGHFKPGKYPQVVMAPGDGNGPLLFLECTGNPADPEAWVRRTLLDREVIAGHTLEVGDINGDGHLDLFCAEMHTPGNGDNATAWLLYGDGQGGFQVQVLSVGIGNHDSRLADVDGDGRIDIVTKPYTWDAPRLDIWLNQG